jgi:ComF family protein
MKYRQRIDIAAYFGKMLCKLLMSKGMTLPDCIMPVPLHSSRLISRGYNQSLELARPLCKRFSIKLDLSSCKRVRATTPQADLPAKKRKSNVRNAFSITGTYDYEHILLLDDVITTGSTVNEIARILSLAGVGRIDVLAVARAG